jgi:flagellar motor switch protein FliG
VRLRDVEEAQQRIVGVIRKMEEEGRIMVARADETVV